MGNTFIDCWTAGKCLQRSEPNDLNSKFEVIVCEKVIKIRSLHEDRIHQCSVTLCIVNLNKHALTKPLLIKVHNS